MKNYGHIAHLPGSRMGPGDHSCELGQLRIATLKARDRHDHVIVQEKLDGTNVGVARVEGVLYPLVRAGYVADTSPFEQHWRFVLASIPLRLPTASITRLAQSAS